MWRRLFAITLLSLALAPAVPAAEVHVLTVDGPIGPATAGYLDDRIDAAAEADAAAVLIRMDTPGGLDSAMRDIIQTILASPVPVMTYVSPAGARAASAGTYILYASHVAAMAPGTNLGAATPVQIGGGGGLPGGGERPTSPDDGEAPSGDGEGDGEKAGDGSAMEAKRVNDAVAYIRALAEMRGRNADWAEKAVREAASLSASAAAEAGVVDLVVADAGSLLEAVDGREVTLNEASHTLQTAGAALVDRPPDWRNRLLAVITNPNVAYILMLIGIYGLIFELANPGAVVPGVIGGICLLIALFAFQALPVNYAGFALILLGIAFMVGEAFVPSFGALGLGGVVAFAAGSLLLFDAEGPGFELSLALVIGVTAASLVVFLGTALFALRAFRRPVVSGWQHLEGAEARVTEGFEHSGHVRVEGELWRAESPRPVAAGERVRVVAVHGLTLEVEPVPGRADPEHVVD